MSVFAPTRLVPPAASLALGQLPGPLPARAQPAPVVTILQQQQTGQTVAHIVREHGISETTFHA